MALSTTEFEQLFKSNHKRLCLLANRIVNDTSEAKDIVQEVFIKVWHHKDNLTNESLDSYLYKATTNTALNYLEKGNKFEKLNSDLNYHCSSLTDQTISVKELENYVLKALNKLPPKCRVIFALNRFEGLRYKEIAEHLDISIKTVENQMGKALQIMREELKPYLTNEFLLFIVAAGFLFSNLS